MIIIKIAARRFPTTMPNVYEYLDIILDPRIGYASHTNYGLPPGQPEWYKSASSEIG